MATYNQSNRFLPFNNPLVNRSRQSNFGFAGPYQPSPTPPINPQQRLAEEYAKINSNRPNRLAYQQAVMEGSPEIERGNWAKLGAMLAGVGSNLGGETPTNSINLGLSAYEMPEMRAKSKYREKLEGLGNLANLEDSDVANELKALEYKRGDYWKGVEESRLNREQSRAEKMTDAQISSMALDHIFDYKDRNGDTYIYDPGTQRSILVAHTGDNEAEEIARARAKLAAEEDVKAHYRRQEQQYDRGTTWGAAAISSGGRAADYNTPAEQYTQIRNDLIAEFANPKSILSGKNIADYVTFDSKGFPTVKKDPWWQTIPGTSMGMPGMGDKATQWDLETDRVQSVIDDSLTRSSSPRGRQQGSTNVTPPVDEPVKSYPIESRQIQTTPSATSSVTPPTRATTQAAPDESPVEPANAQKSNIDINTLPKTNEGLVKMRDPDGNEFDAPAEEVNELIDDGATLSTPLSRTLNTPFPTALSPALGSTGATEITPTGVRRPPSTTFPFTGLPQITPSATPQLPPVTAPAPSVQQLNPQAPGANIANSLGATPTVPQQVAPIPIAAQQIAAARNISPAQAERGNAPAPVRQPLRATRPIENPLPGLSAPPRPNIAPAMPPNISVPPNANIPAPPPNPIQLAPQNIPARPPVNIPPQAFGAFNQPPPLPPPNLQRQPAAGVNVPVQPNPQLGVNPIRLGPPPAPQSQNPIQLQPSPVLSSRTPGQDIRLGPQGPRKYTPEEIANLAVNDVEGLRTAADNLKDFDYGSLDQGTLESIEKTVNPDYRAPIDQEFNSKFSQVNDNFRKMTGYVLKPTSLVRTAKEQAGLYGKDRVSETWRKGPVTEADGFLIKSAHQRGQAYDVEVFTPDGKKVRLTDSKGNILKDQRVKELVRIFGKVASDVGLEWGGKWESLYDPLHVQKEKSRNLKLPKDYLPPPLRQTAKR